MGRKSLNVFSLTVWNIVFHVAIINSEMPYYLIWLKKQTSYMQWVFCLKDIFLQQLLITVPASWHTILVLLSREAKYWKFLFEGSVHNPSVWIKSRMFVWIFLQKVELAMFNGSGIITQAMSPKSSENEQQNSFKCKHTLHKLWFIWLFFFFNKEMNFTADKVEIRQYDVQQVFHPEVF